MNCARHPKVETNLRCGKCNQPICPKCAVQTPVGARCPDCARLTKLPVFQVQKTGYLKAVGTGLALAIVFGVIWGLMIPHLMGYGYLLIILGAYIVSESMSRVVNQKRSVGLQIIAGGCTVLSYVVAFSIGLYISLFSLIALAIAIALSVSRFR